MSYLLDQEQELAKLYPDWIDTTLPGDAADLFGQLDQSTEPLLAEFVRMFAETEIWPAMTRETGSMMRVRLTTAYDYLNGLLFAGQQLDWPQPSREWSRTQWLDWLLVKVWEDVGFANIHGTLESLRRVGASGTREPFDRN